MKKNYEKRKTKIKENSKYDLKCNFILILTKDNDILTHFF